MWSKEIFRFTKYFENGVMLIYLLSIILGSCKSFLHDDWFSSPLLNPTAKKKITLSWFIPLTIFKKKKQATPPLTHKIVQTVNLPYR